MKVALLGATGFVGSFIVPTLLERGHIPRTLVRKGSEFKLVRANECEIILGDLSSVKAVSELIKSSDAVIYNVGIIQEFPKEALLLKKCTLKGLKLA